MEPVMRDEATPDKRRGIQGDPGGRKETIDRNGSRRLRVLMMRHEGYGTAETAKMPGINRSNVYQQYRKYGPEGLKGFTERKYGGNHRALTKAPEKELREPFGKAAEAGQVATARDISGRLMKCAEKMRAGDTSICCWNGMDGGKKCRDRSLRRRQMKRRARPQKMKTCVLEARENMRPNATGCVRLMFRDEAGSGRINKPKRCWCSKAARSSVPCHHRREYRHACGAVEAVTGEHFFLALPRCDTICVNVLLKELSKTYPEDQILPVCDGASWHRSKGLMIPDNIALLNTPPSTPEMNPIGQIRKQLCAMGFKSEVFKTLNHAIDRLCGTICRLSRDSVKSIACRRRIECCSLH